MGVVYKMIFPDGSFYIGSTVNLENRMKAHRATPNKLVGVKTKEFPMTMQEFREIFHVIYEGDDYKEYESDLIRQSRGNELCLNMVGIMYCHPVKICRRKIECTVEYDVYCAFENIKEILECGSEGVMNYLIKLHHQDKERKQRG